MFHGIIQTDYLSEYIETFTSIVDEATLHIGPGEIYAQPVDPANVAMINQTLRDEAFESYSAEDFEIGVNLTQFANYLDAVQSDLVELKYDPETRKLHLTGEATNLTIGLIDPDSIRNGQTLGEDTIDDTVDVVVDGAAFNHAIDVADLVSDHFELDADPNRDAPLHAVGRGDIDDATVEFDKSLHEGSTIDAEATSLYSLEYLQNFQSVIPDDADLRIRVGDEWPLRMDYDYLDGHAEAAMFLAPRIQSD